MPMRPLLVLALVAALAPATAEARPFPGFGGRSEGREAGRPPVDRPAMTRAPIDMPAPRHSDQDYARRAMRAGEIRSLRDISRQWRGDMPGYDFIGSEYDPAQGSYRLKFMREGSVVWVDVDGHGREIRRSGR